MKKQIVFICISVSIFFLGTQNTFAQGWSAQSLSGSYYLNSVASGGPNQACAVGLTGAIVTTTNGGATWTTQTSGTTTNMWSVSFVSPTRGWATGNSGKILVTSDGGVTWTTQTSAVSSQLYGVYFKDASNGWAVGNTGKIEATTNGGATWTAQASGLTAGPPPFGTLPPLTGVYFANTTTGWAVGGSGTIITTSNGGATWTSQTSGVTSSLTSVYFISVLQGWAVGSGGTILATTNGGTTWTRQNSGTAGSLSSVYFTSATKGWVVGLSGLILTTNDGGATWASQTSGTSTSLQGICFDSTGQGFAVLYGSSTLLNLAAPPTTTIASITPATSITNTSTQTFAVTFGAAVTGLSAANFSLSTTGAISGASINSVTGSGTSYAVLVNTGSGDGTIALNLANATGLSSGISTSLPFSGGTATIDKTVPLVTISAPSANSTVTGPITYTITYTDANFSASTLSASNISLNTTGTAAGTLRITGSGTTYTATISGITGSGSLGLSIAAGTATDLAGNSALAAGPSATFSVVSSDATLAGLASSGGAFDQSFAPGTTDYSQTISSSIQTITITPVTNDPNASVNINGSIIPSGTASDPIYLNLGINGIMVTVTAQDGTTINTYTLNINSVTFAPTVQASAVVVGNIKAGSADISWTNGNGDSRAVFMAATSAGSPSPVDGGNYYPDNTFGNGQAVGNWYEVYDSNYSGGQSLTVTGLSGSTTYRVMVIEYNGGQISSPAFLTTGASGNPINFTTTADASLSNLSLSSGSLNGSFSSTVFNYTDSVTNVTTSINVTPIAVDPNAIITVNGATVSSGSASGDIPLNVGDNALAIVVTSSDHLTIDTTTVIVKRADVPPVFGYTGPHVYTPNAAITNLTPANSAGTVGAPGLNYQYNIGSGFDTPHGIAVDAAGNIYVADSENNAIKKIPADGSATITLNSSFNYPCGVAVDAAGNIYIAGYNDNKVWEMAADGSNKHALGSGFKKPQGITVDAAGNVYVSDSQNHRIVKITSGGTMTTLATGLGNPLGIAVDGSGNVYVGDSDNNTVKVIAPGGTTTTLATLPGVSYLTVDNNGKVYVTGFNNTVYVIPAGGGTATTMGSGFSNTIGIAADNKGGVYVSDWATFLVTKISLLSGYYISPALPAGLTFDNTTGAISGTPTAVSAATDYTVKGYNYYGSGTATVNLSVAYDVTLSNLALNNGTLSPAFDGGTMVYTASVNNSVNSITLTPTTNSANTTVAVNGTPVASGSASGPIALHVGSNTINTVVTSLDGTTSNTYTLTITRAAGLASITSDNVNTNLGYGDVEFQVAFNGSISGLKTSNFSTHTTGSLTASAHGVYGPYGPYSDGRGDSQYFYMVDVTYQGASGTIGLQMTNTSGLTPSLISGVPGTTSDLVTITPYPTPTLTIGAPSISNTAIGPLSFPVTYSGQNMSANLTSANIHVNTSGTATYGSVAVTGSGTSYTVTLGGLGGNGQLSINIDPGTGNDDNGNSDSGGSSQSVTVTNNASLASINLSAGVLSPSFNPGITAYNRTLVNGVQSVTITPSASDPNATINVNGSPVLSGATSTPIAVAVGTNTITLTVTAPDHITTQTYNLTLVRAASASAVLTSLKPSRGALSPAFTGNNTTYTATVVNGVTSMTLTPVTFDPNATVTINGTAVTSGTASGDIALAIGPNTITTTVTAQNDTATRTYTLIVTRPAAANASLSALKLSTGTLSPAFLNSVTGYTATVANGIKTITVIPTAGDPMATIVVNGTAVATGTASAPITLNVGDNLITTTVTAQDGTTTKTYTVTVTRAMSNNANLSALKVSRGALSPIFTSANTTYTANVVNGVTSMTVTPTIADPTASVTVNGTPVTSGAVSAAITLAVGSNTISTTVKAQDGTIKTYTLTVTRATGPLSINNPGISLTSLNETSVLISDGIIVHQAISPNGDGINDFLQIENIANYPDNKLSIINRNGQLIFEAKGYDNTSKVFAGRSNKNGQMQLPGTYFYSLEYTVGGTIKHKTGYLVLKY